VCWRAIEEFFHWVSFECYVIVLQVEEPVFSLLFKEFVLNFFLMWVLDLGIDQAQGKGDLGKFLCALQVFVQ
jgi:hypothetical protein